MINRDQVAELLSDAQRPSGSAAAKLEALYSAADDQAKAILARHPDLRPKLHSCIEARIRADQEAQDFRTLVHKIREEMVPSEERKAKDTSDSEDQAERG